VRGPTRPIASDAGHRQDAVAVALDGRPGAPVVISLGA
jgi:hypothetical protein